jgi:hypothetical protein
LFRIGRWVELPDFYALVGCEKELVGGFNIESGIPGVVVADGLGSEVAGGVGVGENLLAEGCVAGKGSPVLSEGYKKLLVSGVGPVGGCGLTFERGAVAVVGSGEASYVGDVFSQGLLAIEGQVGEGFVAVVLDHEGGGTGIEVSEVFRRPPVADSAFGVKCCALGVEGVAYFVTDDSSDGAVVRGGWSLGVKEGWLENGGGEVEAVIERQVNGVDGLRGQGPLLAIDGLTDTVEGVVIVKEAGTPEVDE